MNTKLLRVLLPTLLLPMISGAHEAHDWREDYEAYLSVTPMSSLPQKSFSLKQFEPRLDMDSFKKNLITFASVERKSTRGLDISRTFLTEEYKKLGLEVSLHHFGTGTNFIAEKKGTTNPEKILILSSHIDSVGNKGANDNGTGTIGTLAIARELAKRNYTHTIRILGFDREEKGIAGSDAYVASLRNKENIIGNINIEMIGFHSKNDGAFHVVDCSKSFFGRWIRKPESEFLTTSIKDSIDSLGLDLTIAKTCTDRSDHGSFWRHGIPAVAISENFFGGDPDPCYHSRCDIVDERLNYEYMRKILEAVLNTTEKIIY